MWRSGWALVPSEDVDLVMDYDNDADVEIWDYPWVGFPDGEIEGSDLNRLWSLLRVSPTGKTLWGSMLRDGPDGDEKVAEVLPQAIEAFAGLSDSGIRQLAAAWQQVESPTSSLRRWELDNIIEAIRQLRFLAQQHHKLRPKWELLMVWFL
jgi:hypothetical protein